MDRAESHQPQKLKYLFSTAVMHSEWNLWFTNSLGAISLWQLVGREGTYPCFAQRLKPANLKALLSHGAYKECTKAGTSRCGRKWQPLNGSPGSSHKSHSRSWIAPRGAYLSASYESSPWQWGRAQQVLSPGDPLGFEHHPLAAKQSKALVQVLMLTYLQHAARKGSALLCAPYPAASRTVLKLQKKSELPETSLCWRAKIRFGYFLMFFNHLNPSNVISHTDEFCRWS